MWVANLYNDKGTTLADFIIKHNYKFLPTIICMKNRNDIHKFGAVCPRLKAIICKFNIPLGSFPLREALKSAKLIAKFYH